MVFLYYVVRYSGVILLGPAPQIVPREPTKNLRVTSGPVTLDIRLLSDYKQQPTDAILALRANGWSGRQIANHYNETGYLTPRGRSWIAQGVFSVRKKYRTRIEMKSKLAPSSSSRHWSS